MQNPGHTGRRTAQQLITLSMAASMAFFVACSSDGPSEPDGPEDVITEHDPDDEVGSMQAYGTDDPGSSSGSYTGTLTGKADFEVSANNKTWYTLGPAATFTVNLQENGEPAGLSEAWNIPIATYKYVRVNFENVEGTVDEGSVVDGQTLGGDVHFRLGDTQRAVLVKQAGGFDLTTGGSGQLVVDFNSEVWVTAENLSNREVPKSQFEDAASVAFEAGE